MSHSLNGPSSFSRRKACPASMQMEKGLPDQQSVYAAEGSAAHELGEKCLKEGKNPADYYGQVMGEFEHPDGRIEEFVVDGDMIDAVEVYVDHCRPLMGEITLIEEKLDLRFLGPDEHTKTGYVRGTADFISIKDGILHVVDYKHGRGVAVNAVENAQGLSYGMGAAEVFYGEDWHTLRITIVQPRAFHVLGSVRSWDVPREELLDYKLNFAWAAMETFKSSVTVKAGEHCQFCKAAFHCKGMVEFIKEALGMDVTKNDSNPLDMYTLTEEQVVDILFNKAPTIKKWIAKLEDHAQQRAEQRQPLVGTKLVETRAYRKWKDEVVAEEFFSGELGDEAFDSKFKSPAQLEKLMGKNKFAEFEEEFTIKKSSGVTVVPIDDPREDVRPLAENEFGSVEEPVNLFG